MRGLVLWLVLALWVGAPAWAQSSSGLGASGLVGSTTERLYEQAMSHERAGRLGKAAAGYRLVLRKDPVHVASVVGLGRVLARNDDVDGAVSVLERLPHEAEAVRALAVLVEEEDPARAAMLYGKLTTLRLGDTEPWLWQARAQIRVDPVVALETYETWRELADGVHDGDVLVELAAALRNGGAPLEAAALLEDYLAGEPAGAAAQEARGRLDRIQVEQAAEALGVGGSAPLTARLSAQVDGARQAAAAGQLDEALATLREVVLAAPRSDEARGALGEVYLARGEVADAEQAWLWATTLAPEEPTWHARLGLLLAQRYGGRRHAEAVEELSRALGLRPSWSELHFHIGVAQQEKGAWTEAERALQTYVESESDGAFAEDARQRLEDLRRTAPVLPPLPGASPPPDDIPVDALQHYRIARIYLDRGELEAARAELIAVRRLAEGWPAAINLEAALALREGDESAAVSAWERSLLVEPNQPRVRLTLGEVLRRQGDEAAARTLLVQAAEGGAADAHYLLAAMAWEDHDLLGARDHLDAYFAHSTGGLGTEPARELQLRVTRRIQLIVGSFVAAGGVALLGLVSWWWRRRGILTVAELAEAAPEATYDLARLLSAVRHEVLKHNTTLLDDVAHALEHGDHSAVSFAAGRLFGEGGEGGVVARFEHDLDALVRLARRHGLRVAPRRKDPVLTPMWRAMERLRKLEGALRRPWRAKRGVPDELRAISEALNQVAYRGLGRLVRQMGTLDVDLERIAGVDRRVRAEHGAEAGALPPLELVGTDASLPTRVFAGDLDDVLANLLRNAYRAMAMLPPKERRIAVELDDDDDPITGLEHVLIRVWDSAPGSLTESMIRGRSIGRGLGLVVDLVTRHDGSIGIVPAPGPGGDGFTKAVEVRLLRAEVGDDVGLPTRVEVEEVP